MWQRLNYRLTRRVIHAKLMVQMGMFGIDRVGSCLAARRAAQSR